MAARASIVVRAVLAIVLMVMFFLTAAVAIVALVLAGKFLFGLAGEIRGRGILLVALAGAVCFAAAAVVAWSMLPRPDKFEPPGPEITAAEQPELFGQLEEVAAATGEAMPAHVYLVRDVNAFVTQRGGLMGVGSRRVMGLGLPLMRAITVSEMRAVVAHEMGHFYGGDTRLGPWIYKTRGSMIRTVVNLGKAGQSGGEVHELIPLVFAAVRAPFVWFAKGFLRVSQAVSRAQEFSADGVAVRTEGADALIEGLKKTHAAAVAHPIYLRNEVAPLVDRGALPPVGEGFTRFLGAERTHEVLAKVVDAELDHGTQDPYDSHPPLRDRIAAARRHDAPVRELDDRPAIALIRDPDRYELQHIRDLVDQPLAAISWDDIGRYWVDAWRDDTSDNRAALRGLTVATLSRDLRALRALMRKVHAGRVDDLDDEQVRGWTTYAVGSALAVMLAEAGFAVAGEVGAPHRLVRGDDSIEPLKELAEWLDGDGADDALVERYRALDLADHPLA